jgi:hypothetical protein
MADPEEKKIPIKDVIGREEGQKLIGCYFKPKADGTYNFHAHDGAVKGRQITVGRTFRFELDDAPGVFWTLNLETDADEILKGRWNDKNDPDPSLEDGTYQAQAGGQAEDAASAYA